MKKLLLLLSFLTIFVNADEFHSEKIKIFFDINHTLDQNSIYALKEKMQEVNNDDLSYGYKEDSVWLYINVKNNMLQGQSRFIVFEEHLIDYMKVWEYTNKKQSDYFHMGYLEPFSNRKIADAKLIIPYTLDAHEEKEFIIKVNTGNAMRLIMQFKSRENYYKSENNTTSANSFYFGAVSILLIYNFLLYHMIGQRIYLYYVLFHFMFMFVQIILSGIGFELFWPEYSLINHYILPIVIALTNIFFMKFILIFLDIKKYSPRISKFYTYMIFFYISIVLLTFILSTLTMSKLILIVISMSVLIYYIVALYIFIRFRTMDSFIFLVAWLIFFISIIITTLLSLGLVSTSFLTINASKIGSLIELSLLSCALAHNYNSILGKLTTAQIKVEELNASLQKKVHEQTKKLQLAISELHHRIKNNFQFITTFLWAQKRSTDSPEVANSLEEINDRIYAISSLHETLNTHSGISISNIEYFSRIIENYKYDNESVQIKTQFDNIPISYDDLVALGLILNELLTNSFKYAFVGIENAKISVKFSKYLDRFMFSYKDNGIGCDIEKTRSKSGFGFEFINEFSNGLDDCEKDVQTHRGMSYELNFRGKLNYEH